MSEIDTKFETGAEYDSFAINAKSSVKLSKNSRGINWDIKVVTGEAHLIEDLMKQAVVCHKELIKQIEVQNE